VGSDLGSKGEGTRTRQDYKENRADKKNDGPYSGKKFAQKSRNSCSVNGRSVGEHGQLTHGTNERIPRTKYKRSKNVFAVTSIALIVAHVCTKLWQLLIGSPGTLPRGSMRFWWKRLVWQVHLPWIVVLFLPGQQKTTVLLRSRFHDLIVSNRNVTRLNISSQLTCIFVLSQAHIKTGWAHPSRIETRGLYVVPFTKARTSVKKREMQLARVLFI